MLVRRPSVHLVPVGDMGVVLLQLLSPGVSQDVAILGYL
jgi:hypothetical protein